MMAWDAEQLDRLSLPTIRGVARTFGIDPFGRGKKHLWIRNRILKAQERIMDPPLPVPVGRVQKLRYDDDGTVWMAFDSIEEFHGLANRLLKAELAAAG